jgi:ionotropic glutamate receptor
MIYSLINCFGTKKIRLLDLHQTGLLDFWDTWFRPMPPQCTGNIQSGHRKARNKTSSLSLKNLTGPFIVIAVGLSFSLLAFLLEHILCAQERNQSPT